MVRVHLILAALWALLAVPAALWWRDSVLFVAMASIYANCVGHLAAFQAAHAERRLLRESRKGGRSP